MLTARTLRCAVFAALCACDDTATDDLTSREESEVALGCVSSMIGTQAIKTCSYPPRGAFGRRASLIDAGLGSRFSEITDYNPDELGDYWFLFWEFGDKDVIFNGALSASVDLDLSCYMANVTARMFYHSNPSGTPYFVKIPKATFQSSCPSNFSADDATNVAFLAQRISFGTPTAPVGRFNLAGVHFFSGRSSLIDVSLPFDLRGWNVELVTSAAARDNSAVANARVAAQAGLRNIIRIDYEPHHATPNGCALVNGNAPQHCWDWSFAVMDRIRDFTVNERLATIFIIGNEPNIEMVPMPQDYAAAFNHLYQARAAEIQRIETELGIDIQILAAGPSGFYDTQWFFDMTHALQGVDGFALHTYGRMDTCADPRQWCGNNQDQDMSFRFYRSLINRMDPRWHTMPVYITETNTDDNGGPSNFPDPKDNYVINWINEAFAEIRDYNATRGSFPEVRSLCWFVDSPRNQWNNFALSNPTFPRLVSADTDMTREFRVRANIFN